MMRIIENEIVDIYRKLYDRGLNPDQIVDIRERLYITHRLLVASEDSWPIKTCSCGRQHMAHDWLQLPLVGYQSLPTIGGELRNCVCGSTMVFGRREAFSTTYATILRHTIIGEVSSDTRPPFSLQECMNITIAYSKMQDRIYLDRWSDMQVLEAAFYGRVPESNVTRKDNSMTPKRAQEIIQAAYDKATCGPWSDQLDKVMTKEERAEVNAVWDTMPGDTCFVDAIYRIARTEDPGWSIRTKGSGT